MANRDEAITELPLRSRRTFDSESGVSQRQSVMCLARGRSVDIDACMDCGYCARAPKADDRTLGCLHPAAHRRPATTARPVRPPAASELTALHDVMTKAVVCVRSDLLVESLATLLVERNISAVPVVDGDGRPIGVATKTDLVRWYREEAEFAEAADVDRESLELGVSSREVRSTTVHDVMMPLAFTLNEKAPLAYAAALMTVEGIHHLPIVSGTGEVVGIISALDLVRWMAQRGGFVYAEGVK